MGPSVVVEYEMLLFLLRLTAGALGPSIVSLNTNCCDNSLWRSHRTLHIRHYTYALQLHASHKPCVKLSSKPLLVFRLPYRIRLHAL